MKLRWLRLFGIVVIIMLTIVVACKKDSSSISSGPNNQWVWVKGANTVNQQGVYGTKGVASANTVPGSRVGSISWIDGSNNLWLFGGLGYDSTGVHGYLNDLWKFDPSIGNWTWVSGANTVNQQGSYGMKGVAASANIPGARIYSSSWIDGSGNLWLFGGYGIDSSVSGYEFNYLLNDLWKFDPSSGNWTWVSGANTINQKGTYGTKGIADSVNIPGARADSTSWIDGRGNLWLFGGDGFDSSGSGGPDLNHLLNDLWKFDPSIGNWTWVSGANTVNQQGSYGMKGVAASANIPGARISSPSWIDGSGNLWLFGGYSLDSTGAGGVINDLWKYEPTNGNWTWVNGANTINQQGTYGTQGIAASSNVPGARQGAVTWTDGSGNLWLFGGDRFDSSSSFVDVYYFLNDLWKFDPSSGNWVWVSGANTFNQQGTYGTQGIAASANVPGARQGAVTWTDRSGKLWLFGGDGFDSSGAGSIGDYLNDLWRYYP